MRFLVAVLFPFLALACGSTADRSEETTPSGPEKGQPAPQVTLVKGQAPDAPPAPPKLVYRISRATPPDVPGALRGGLDAVVASLRAGRVEEAHRAWQGLAAAARSRESVHWVLREAYLLDAARVMDASNALAQHEERRTQLRDEATQAREIANSLSQGYTLRYERLDPVTLKRRAPARVTGEELGVYAGELDTAEKRLRDDTSTLRREFEQAMEGNPEAIRQLSNAMKLFLGS